MVVNSPGFNVVTNALVMCCRIASLWRAVAFHKRAKSPIFNCTNGIVLNVTD